MGWTTSTRIWPTLYLLKSPISWYPANLWSFFEESSLDSALFGSVSYNDPCQFWSETFGERYFGMTEGNGPKISVEAIWKAQDLAWYRWWFRNPGPVEVGRLSHYLQGFIHPTGFCLGFLNHQQYHYTNPTWTSLLQKWFTPLPSKRRMLFWLKPDEPFIGKRGDAGKQLLHRDPGSWINGLL